MNKVTFEGRITAIRQRDKSHTSLAITDSISIRPSFGVDVYDEVRAMIDAHRLVRVTIEPIAGEYLSANGIVETLKEA